tara:strand:- start:19317 stop:19739 length:423 start_codon:yes stop_codon:yes gene_type:complete
MGIPTVDVNLVAVVVTAIIVMVIGALWYSPLFFGKTWAKHSGMTKKDIAKTKKKSMNKQYFLGFVTTLIMTYVLAYFLAILNITTAREGMQIAFWIWIGFFATTQFGTVLWEGKSAQLYYLNATHYLVSLLIMGLLLTVW